MKNFLLKAFEIFCRLWLALAWAVAGFIVLAICFVKWLLTPTQPEEDPESLDQKTENWFGAVLIFLLAAGSYLWFTVIG